MPSKSSADNFCLEETFHSRVRLSWSATEESVQTSQDGQLNYCNASLASLLYISSNILQQIYCISLVSASYIYHTCLCPSAVMGWLHVLCHKTKSCCPTSCLESHAKATGDQWDQMWLECNDGWSCLQSHLLTTFVWRKRFILVCGFHDRPRRRVFRPRKTDNWITAMPA